MVDVVLEGKSTWNLVRWTPEVVKMKYIHGNVHEYRTKELRLKIWGKAFVCRVWVMPCLDCPVLQG